MTDQEKYEYVVEMLDGSLSEAFAYDCTMGTGRSKKLDLLYHMVKDWAESPKGQRRIKQLKT